MLFAVISDVVWQAIIAGVVTLVLAWLNQRTKAAVEKGASDTQASLEVNSAATVKSVEKANKEAVVSSNIATDKADQLKQAFDVSTKVRDEKLDALQQTADDTKKTGQAIHVLVNSSMSKALETSMNALHRIAAITNLAEDYDAADLAAKVYHEHEAKQAALDKSGMVVPEIPAEVKKAEAPDTDTVEVRRGPDGNYKG